MQVGARFWAEGWPHGHVSRPPSRRNPVCLHACSPLQGSRVLPLLKACLLENLRLTTAAEAAAAARAPTALSTAAEAEAEAPPAAKPPSRGSEAGSDAGSVKSPAGTAPAPSPSRVAPASPATPAHALREGPPPPRPPPPEPEQGQGQAAPAFNVDDLLGLSGWVSSLSSVNASTPRLPASLLLLRCGSWARHRVCCWSRMSPWSAWSA